jgi:hypothetical protein
VDSSERSSAREAPRHGSARKASLGGGCFAARDLITRYSIDLLIGCQSQFADADVEVDVFLRQLLNDDTACASYLLGCKSPLIAGA